MWLYWKGFRSVAEDIGVMPGALFRKRYRVAIMITHKWLFKSQQLLLFERDGVVMELSPNLGDGQAGQAAAVAG